MARKRKTYGFGVIGCGNISGVHAQSIGELPNAELVACHDVAEAAAKRMAEERGCEFHASLDEMLARDDVDVVCVCTPSGAHRDPAVAAAKAGKHVVVEKPLEVTLPRADAIIDACDEAGVRLVTVFPTRFRGAAVELKKAVDKGRFGRLTLGDCYNKWWRSQEYYDNGGWHGTWKLDGGGAIMNQAIHAVDLLQWYMGEVDTVMAFAGCLAHERIEVEDTAVAAIRFKSGALGTLEAATSVNPPMERRIEIHGDHGSAVMERGEIVRWEFAKGSPGDKRVREKYGLGEDNAKSGNSSPTPPHTGHKRQIAQLLDVLDKGGEVLVDGREGRKAIEVTIAIYRSAKTGRAVKLPLKS